MESKTTTTNFVGINLHPMNLQEIGQQIKIARNAKGWNQEDLAQAAGISQAQVSDHETGNGKGGRESLKKCLLALNLQVCITTPSNEEIEQYRSTGDKPINEGD